MQAAFTVAQVLKSNNSDFKDWSYHELVNAIMDDKHPVGLDKKPIEARKAS
jgi:hypothetical protein